MTDPDTNTELSRRDVLRGAGAAGGGAAMLAAALGGDAANAIDVIGGNMALQEATQVSGKLYIGPPGSRTDISPETGRVIMEVGSGGEVRYYGDGSSWTRLGLGNGQDPVPSVTTDQVNNIHFADPADDAPGIQTLIDNASAGDVIYLKSGTYDATTSFDDGVNITVPSGKPLKITGDEGATIKVPDGALDSGEGAKVITVLANGTIIEDITIDGNHQNNSPSTSKDGHNLTINADDCLVRGVTSINATGDGIVVDGDRCRIIGPTVKDCFEMGVQFAAGQQANLAGGTIRDTVNGANLMLKPSTVGSTLQDINISGVNLLGGSDLGLAIKPAEGTVKNINLDNITARGAANYNIVIGAATSSQTNPQDVTLSDVTSLESGKDGMLVNGVDDLELIDPIVKRAQDHGIRVQPSQDCGRVRIDGGTVYDNNQSATSKIGVYVKGTSNNYNIDIVDVTGVTVRGGVSYGVYMHELGSSTEVEVSDVKATDVSSSAYNISPTPRSAGGNYPPLAVDVTSVPSPDTGQRMFNDGGANSGIDGWYVYDGSNWVREDDYATTV